MMSMMRIAQVQFKSYLLLVFSRVDPDAEFKQQFLCHRLYSQFDTDDDFFLSFFSELELYGFSELMPDRWILNARGP